MVIIDLCFVYFRDDMEYVDIYFGDLEVESIIEQKDYESFQFICKYILFFEIPFQTELNLRAVERVTLLRFLFGIHPY